MNILLINWMDLANPQAGGAEVHIVEIFRRFVERGDEVTFVTSNFPGGLQCDVADGMTIYRTGTRETFNIAAPRLIRKMAKERHFDLVVEDINKVPLFTPLFVSQPVLVIIPHLFGSAVFRETNPLFASYVYLLERPLPHVYRNAMFEVISESTSRDIHNRGIHPERIRIAHCGVDHGTYTYDPGLPKYDRPTVLYVGRIKKYKSVDVMVRSMPLVLKSVPDAHAVVVGDGDGIASLRKLAADLGIADHVDFTGFVSTEEKVELMRRSHVIVNPSPKEGWGLTNIEANACGTVAVASDADGLRDSVRDGETGLLFPYGDHAACAERIVRILTDSAERERLTANALKWASGFTWDRTARLTMEIADEMVAGI